MSLHVSGIEWRVQRKDSGEFEIFRRIPRRGWQLKAAVRCSDVVMLSSFDDGLTCWFDLSINDGEYFISLRV